MRKKIQFRDPPTKEQFVSAPFVSCQTRMFTSSGLVLFSTADTHPRGDNFFSPLEGEAEYSMYTKTERPGGLSEPWSHLVNHPE